MKSIPDALAGQGMRKPTDDELDVYGLTHPGKVRKTNQDHFLICICSLRKQVLVDLTGLPDLEQLPACSATTRRRARRRFMRRRRTRP